MDAKVYITHLIHEDTEYSLRVEEQFEIELPGNLENQELYLAEKDIQALALTEDL